MPGVSGIKLKLDVCLECCAVSQLRDFSSTLERQVGKECSPQAYGREEGLGLNFVLILMTLLSACRSLEEVAEFIFFCKTSTL